MNLFKIYINKFLSYFGYKVIRNKKVKRKNESEQAVINIEEPYNNLLLSNLTMKYFIENFKFDTVLDIGSGEGLHSDIFKKSGKIVTSIDFGNSVYFNKRDYNHTCIIADYLNYRFDNKFDAIWASHVLEHQPNPNLFLKKIFNDLKEGGILAITVPPLKHEIVGGHVTLWNGGLLLYHLVLAGFNCKDVSINAYGYNISVVLRKKSISKFPELCYDKGDIEKLLDYFPDGFKEPFEGDIKELNW